MHGEDVRSENRDLSGVNVTGMESKPMGGDEESTPLWMKVSDIFVYMKVRINTTP